MELIGTLDDRRRSGPGVAHTVGAAPMAASASQAEAFGDAFARYRAPLYGYALHYLANPADAEEVVQEVFLRLYLQLRREAGLNVRPWLYRAATNLCIDLLRARARHPDQGAGAPQAVDLAPAAEKDGPEGVQLQREQAEEVRRVLAALPEAYRQVLVLRQMQDLSYDEIAEVLGISVEALTSLLHRARLAFREAYRASHPKGDREVNA